MTRRFTVKTVEDIASEGVGERDITQLLDIAAYAIEKISPTLARMAFFNLSDFAMAKRRGVSGFDLTLSRQMATEQDTWIAEFKRGSKSVRILLTVVEPD